MLKSSLAQIRVYTGRGWRMERLCLYRGDLPVLGRCASAEDSLIAAAGDAFPQQQERTQTVPGCPHTDREMAAVDGVV
ncbi:MAG TPA: hypothetical protein P5568_13995, partial [Acidobacteriota bacterium]|nr:hypothetical protein [Acidobacteriota bacterium]